MKKWIISGISYLLIVIIGYSVYANVFSEGNEVSHDEHAGHMKEEVKSEEVEETEEEGHGAHGEGHGDHGGHGEQEATGQSEIISSILIDEENITVQLSDLEGKPFDDLKVNHEKLLHLIVVDEHLEQYFHLHPDKVEPGVFVAQHDFSEGTYKAFIDIKPNEKLYSASPVEFVVGNVAEGEHSHAGHLKVDQELQKTVNDITVELEVSSFTANEESILTFKFPEEVQLEPYLGAMGHVVILDETATQYIHVHPLNNDDTVFEAIFPEAGIYKLWAEFQINDQIFTYPFVIEVK